METNKIPTAEEFALDHEIGNTKRISIEDAKEVMIEFAKLHVKAALESASEKAMVHYEGDINREQILNSYNYDNIK